METISLKALARRVLERNQQRNHKETQLKINGNFKGENDSKSFLAASTGIEGLTETEKEDYEERAAIMEFDGNMPRKEAERKALERILKLRNLYSLN